MKKFVKIFCLFVCCFILQSFFEIILMSLLAKFGIHYMNMDAEGESLIEISEGLAVYYFYSRLLYMGPIYLIFSLSLSGYFYKKEYVTIKRVILAHIFVYVAVFLALWFGFGNGLSPIINPLLGAVCSGFLTYFLIPLLVKKRIELSHWDRGLNIVFHK